MTTEADFRSAPASSLAGYVGRQRIGVNAPWPSVTLVTDTWQALALRLEEAPWSLLGEWACGDTVSVALCDPADGMAAVMSLKTVEGRYPTLSQVRPSAIRLERAIADLSGLSADGLADSRPWLDHGMWPLAHPLGETEARRPGALPSDYAFLPSIGESLHQIPVGPIHAGIIEPGHFRFTCYGEAVVRLEDRLGYVHKGVESLMSGASLSRAACLAGRVSGDSTVAYALAFARAAEAATGTEVTERAHALRGVMAELERIANHIGDIGAICNDVAFGLMQAHCGVLREQVSRASALCFGHRMMMDRVVPGGVTVDLDAAGLKRLRALVVDSRPRFEDLVRLYDSTPSLQTRMIGSGAIAPELVAAWGAGGFVGRAAGRGFDARVTMAYPPYDRLELKVPVLSDGDVNARVLIRIDEVRESLSLIERLLDELPEGPARVPLAAGGGGGGQGMALVEGFRGDILAWLSLTDDGRVERCHLRDPSWFQWPLLMVAIEGAPVADFPVCNKSFNCSYSGHDL